MLASWFCFKSPTLTLNAHVGKEEQRAQPRHLILERLTRSESRSCFALAAVLPAVHLARLLPEGDAQPDPFDRSDADLAFHQSSTQSCSTLPKRAHHHVVVSIPGEPSRDNHVGRNQRRHECAEGVARMHDALYGVRLVHRADPRAKAGVSQSVAEATDHVQHDEHGVRRVNRQGDEGDDMAQWRHNCDTALAKFHMDPRISKGRNSVSGKWRQEDEGHNGVSQVVVRFELHIVSIHPRHQIQGCCLVDLRITYIWNQRL